MGCACFTNFGLAEYIPLTSVQISKTSALIAAAIIAAVKSEPPRPNVLVSPVLVKEIKPGSIVI